MLRVLNLNLAHRAPLVFALTITIIALCAQPCLDDLGSTYLSIVKANQAGANTTSLTSQLNYVINSTLNRGKWPSPERLAEIREEAARLASLAHRLAFWYKLILALAFGSIVLLLALAYYSLIVKGAIWKIWLRMRENHLLRVRKERAHRSSMLLDDEVRAVLAAILVIILIFAATQYFTAGRVAEPFSELGLLGRNKKLADYPSNLTVGETAMVYIYVGNLMGRPMLYRIDAKLGNESSPVNPSLLSPFWTYYLVLEHNSSSIIPLNFSVNRTGVYRLIVELWAYNETVGDFQYNNWVHLWVNVSSP